MYIFRQIWVGALKVYRVQISFPAPFALLPLDVFRGSGPLGPFGPSTVGPFGPSTLLDLLQ